MSDALTPNSRIVTVLRDTWTITRRDLQHWAAQPAPVVISLLFPVMTVLMFGYLFGGALSVPGGGSYREFLLPGMFTLTRVFGIEMTMVAVVTDAQHCITDRFRSLPMASSAVLLGRSNTDMLNAVAGLAVMIGCGLAVGWQAREGFTSALAGYCCSCVSRSSGSAYFSGWSARGRKPSPARRSWCGHWDFCPTRSSPPPPCRDGSGRSPSGTRCRPLCPPPGHCSATLASAGGSWAAEHAAALAVAWPVLLIAVFVPLAARRFRRLSY